VEFCVFSLECFFERICFDWIFAFLPAAAGMKIPACRGQGLENEESIRLEDKKV